MLYDYGMEEFTIPVKLLSELNTRDHWTKKAKRTRILKILVKSAWNKKPPSTKPPCTVTLVRVSPRELDSDNLQGAFKSVRDAVADLLIPGMPAGRADGSPLITWNYVQEKNSPCIKIRLEPRND